MGREPANMADTDESGDQLTETQNEVLQHFQEITGIEDIEKCKEVLARHDWQIETAVQDTFNKAENSPAVFETQESMRESSTEGEDSNSQDERINGQENQNISIAQRTVHRGAIQRPSLGWFQWFCALGILPFRFVHDVTFGFLRYVVRLVWPSLFQPRTMPLEDVLKFKGEFEEQYGEVHPTFYQGSYSQALNDAKKELRFLLVYLHCQDHEDTDEFCRSTVTNPGFREYVNGNMLFWAINIRSPEGHRVSAALRESTYPFMALICRRDNRMTIVGRMEGLMTVDQYVALLARLIEDNEPALIVARDEIQARSQVQYLREEQDAAYMESLRADQEKERRRREQLECQQREEDNRRQKEEALRNKEESIARARSKKKQCLPAEPSRDHPGALPLVIKLPNGKRLERVFLKSHPLQALYDFVFCDEESPEQFVLASSFPRKEFHPDGGDVTLENAGIQSSAVLFVRDTAEESDSD